LACKPGLAGRSYVLPLLLSRVRRPFLRLMRWRAKKRERLLVLIPIPRACSASRNSRRKICGWAWEVCRMRSA
jgi:hypothetical protein